MKPNLIIPGAAKSGTSSLHEYLNLHPDIEMSREKEPYYFTLNKRYAEGLTFYDNLFNNKKARYWGESSTAYFVDRVALKRIKKELGGVKFIVILRDPVMRAVSHYLWQVSLFEEFRSFRNAVEYNIRTPVDFRKPGWGGHFKSYYEESLYGEKLQYLINEFGRKNIYVITSKELINDANKALHGCFEYLGLKPITITVDIKANTTSKIDDRKGRLRSFCAKAIRRGVLDFRLLYLAAKNKVGNVSKEDLIWLRDILEEDIRLLQKYYPDIDKRW
ncbi:hypothetical protein G3570_08645 [Balneolaceae bacterium YR4-1]|uniref:Sulfotransferase domain-containing protein n=1 Tax=Halalkalibaculum roseum TaxID=2709311 RepID=A0A6M1SNR1_9BACT|nr:sulfotransferase domain-containing protein [Halalkalibaculum roseum]NGP76699.1 hypothetical protein [Halalkalibaculum roseum]